MEPVPGERSGNGIVALELAANETWPALDQDRLGSWLLRAAGGWTGRANSALPLGEPGRPLPAAIAGFTTHHRYVTRTAI